MDSLHDVLLVRPENVPWEIVLWIQIKRYDYGRRIALNEAGPLKSLPLLGSVRRFAVEVIYNDSTWDRTHSLGDPVEAHRIANKMSLIRSLPVRVVP